MCGCIVGDKHTWIRDFGCGTNGQLRTGSAAKAGKDISFVPDNDTKLSKPNRSFERTCAA
jgi:hypothetical protein